MGVQPGQVAVLEIRRPPINFFDIDLIRDLAGALERLADDGECRAVVLCSEGKHFCAGANFGSGERHSGISREDEHLYDVAIRLFEQPLIVAAIQGAAIGGGLGLALAADFRVACSEARFSANFARLGFHHGFGLSVTLPMVVGHQRSLELLYTGRRIDGDDALRIGLCDRLVPLVDVRSASMAFADDIATLKRGRASLGRGAYSFVPVVSLDQAVLLGFLAHQCGADVVGEMSAHGLSNGPNRQWR